MNARDVGEATAVCERCPPGRPLQGEVFHKCLIYRGIALLPPAGGGWEGPNGGRVCPVPSRTWVSPLLAPPAGRREAPYTDVSRDLSGNKPPLLSPPAPPPPPPPGPAPPPRPPP